MKIKQRHSVFDSLLILFTLLIFSCRTISTESPNIMEWLPEDAGILLKLNVANNAALADTLTSLAGIPPKKIASARKRTSYLAAALNPEGQLENFNHMAFEAVIIGIWPRSILGAALGKDWKRSPSDRQVWMGPDGLQLSAPSRQELLLSRGKLDDLIKRRANPRVSSHMMRIPEDADFAMIVRSTDFIDSVIPALSGQISALSAALYRQGDDYSVRVSIYPADERRLRALALALRIGLSARFGPSSDPRERELLSSMDIGIHSGEIRLLTPLVSVTLIENLLAEMLLLQETE